ncbi:MAG: mannose-1-phosphate guanylyltransferase/mannose-6-phosphate isomerase [Actinobacteria bacterium]|nr:mannose-1-phosphate guanylyltransferase/mannose-6-phosphate isomerase [Actinomycetota bacterium]
MVDSRNLYGVILAGGAGTRFWPLSREMSPKQLLKVFGTESLIWQTIKRLLPLIPQEQIYVVTNSKLADEIRTTLITEKDSFDKVGYLVEPQARNTAPAIGLAVMHLSSIDPDAVMVVLPSDHIINNPSEFLSVLEHAAELAQADYLVTLGLKPSKPETGFGYIKAGAPHKDHGKSYPSFIVESFVEKPDRETAKSYIQSGDYYWNSGMFVFKASTILGEIKRLMPNLYYLLIQFKDFSLDEWGSEKAKAVFSKAEAISIDYGVMEKSDKVAVIPVDLDWNDVGSLTALGDFLEKDAQINATIGNVINIESKNSIIYGDERLVTTLGLENMIVIDTHDATLVCPKDRAQDVRKIVDILKAREAEEYLVHRTVHRPWGCYTLLERGPNFKIKVIKVRPGERLSLQLHHHRSEHWVVISGTARVTRGNEIFNVHVNESTFIPPSTIHRLENPGMIPLKIIEVQNGEYLEEDDIVRTDDDYFRKLESDSFKDYRSIKGQAS